MMWEVITGNWYQPYTVITMDAITTLPDTKNNQIEYISRNE